MNNMLLEDSAIINAVTHGITIRHPTNATENIGLNINNVLIGSTQTAAAHQMNYGVVDQDTGSGNTINLNKG